MTTENERGIILDILFEVLEKDQYSHLVIRRALDKFGWIPKQERAFIDRVSRGTIEHLLELDDRINQVSSVKTARMKPVIRTILRMTAYQLCYTEVPAHAACNEAVKLAKQRGFGGLQKFVNGVCRALARQADSYDCTGSEELYYSMPVPVLEMLHSWYPQEQVTAMLNAFRDGERPPVYAHFHLHRASEQEILDSLQRQGVAAEPARYAKDCWKLSGIARVADLEAFSQGWIQIQDVGSALAAQCVSPKPGSRCLDLCGAPGSKSVWLAEAMDQTGEVVCRDVSAEKLPWMEENRIRCGLSNMKTEIWDARMPYPGDENSYDYVIADVPCSGLGVIGRKPDIRYRITKEDLLALLPLQRAILKQAAAAVKPDGVLVYSTCTINPEENKAMVQQLLAQGGWKMESLAPFLSETPEGADLSSGMLQLLPGIHPSDGFFAARLRKLQAEPERGKN